MNTNPQLLEPVFTRLQKNSFNLTVRAPGMSFRKDSALHCPFCHHEDSRVIDSRTSEDGASIRRRRECPHCGGRFTTVETTLLLVKKRSGVTEPFSRDKVIAGMAKATQGRPITDSQLALLAQGVEETLRQKGAAVINAEDVGKAILEPLKALDEVAYLRFASVYSDFNTLEDFEAAIASLKHRR
ncbi:transcriptional repressor NrdR [Mobiluncus mulieris]|uniref:Transcriptional repressor NrdR n=2 Tax=Mobiluncus mulieris TaxID=2052 RepID=A0A7Y0U1U9_9ACTO|nr:transcriptional repressor NrdR [Mobiluncus mulieris]NMX03895.1 transcriptional repressor NrdR [Mobiluncus mulieris]NMX11777.1 transcriptional repressor NrdR [Mobiluncus mulieris]